MSPGKRTPEDQGWRWKTDEGEFDVGYADQRPDGSSTEVVRAKGHVTEDEREAQLDAVLIRDNNDKTSGEIGGVKGHYNLDEHEAGFSVTGLRSTNKDGSGGFAVVDGSAEGHFGGFDDFGLQAKGTLLDVQTDTVDVKLATASADASTGDGKTVLGLEANLFSFGAKPGSNGNESQLGFDVGLGGTVEAYHGEDSDRDGKGEWGVKAPLIFNEKLNQKLEDTTERLLGRPVNLSVGFRIEPGPAIERIQDLGSDIGEGIQDLGSDIGEEIQDLGTNLRQRGTSIWDRINDRFPVSFGNNETGGILRGGVGQISGMRRLDEAFARLQSLF